MKEVEPICDHRLLSVTNSILNNSFLIVSTKWLYIRASWLVSKIRNKSVLVDHIWIIIIIIIWRIVLIISEYKEQENEKNSLFFHSAFPWVQFIPVISVVAVTALFSLQRRSARKTRPVNRGSHSFRRFIIFWTFSKDVQCICVQTTSSDASSARGASKNIRLKSYKIFHRRLISTFESIRTDINKDIVTKILATIDVSVFALLKLMLLFFSRIFVKRRTHVFRLQTFFWTLRI